MKKLIKIDKNGTKYWADDTCRRCGGAGERSEWYYTGMVCYECGGTGRSKVRVEKEYTPEYEAKLAERRAEREARKLGYASAEAMRMARKAEEEAKRLAEEEAERKAKEEAERKAREEAERKAISQYVGEVGTKITVKGTFDHTAWYDTRDPFGREVRRYIHSFRDESGNLLVWKTSSGLGRLELEEGEPIILSGTVKEHTEYKDEKQTALLRCKVVRPE